MTHRRDDDPDEFDGRGLRRRRNHKWITAGSLATVVSILAILTYLGVLPWATRAEVGELKRDVTSRIERIDQRVDDLHRLFFPARRRPND